jgi:hypothetical protein
MSTVLYRYHMDTDTRFPALAAPEHRQGHGTVLLHHCPWQLHDDDYGVGSPSFALSHGDGTLGLRKPNPGPVQCWGISVDGGRDFPPSRPCTVYPSRAADEPSLG